jgi:hypothetical protein
MSHPCFPPFRILARLVLLVLAGAGVWAGDATVAAQLRELTGARTKIVWIRASGGVGHPFGPMSPQDKFWRIMVLDTDEGKERCLVPEPNVWNHTMITPSGNRVIWTGPDRQIWICDWDGKNRRQFLEAKIAVGVAEDPPGVEWVYIHGDTTVHVSNTDQAASVFRCQIDNPAKRELVWDKTGSNDKWEFTRDGKVGASGLPWPNAGVATLPNGELLNFGVGCTPGVSGDGSLVMHMLAAGHRGIFVYDRDGTNKRYMSFEGAPGVAGVTDPQFWWASFVRYDKRFFTFSGPHPGMGTRGQSHGDIYFCKFNEKSDGVANWVRVTDSPEVETHGYGYIDADPYGPKPTDKLVAVQLDALVKNLVRAKAFKPILDEAEKLAADAAGSGKAAEARRIIDHILGWGRHALAQAQHAEAVDLPAAVEVYRDLAAKYAELEVGKVAAARLAEPNLDKDLEVWKKHMADIVVLEKALTAPPDSKRPANPRTTLAALDAKVEALVKEYPGTKGEAAGKASAKRARDWAVKQFAAGQELEATNPAEAQAIYKDLAARFAGAEGGAKARLDDPAFKRQCDAWDAYLKKVAKLEAAFVAVPNAKPQVSDAAWLQTNQGAVTALQRAARSLQKQFPDTVAMSECQKLLGKYGISLEGK